MGITTKSDIALVALKANTASLALTASYFSGSVTNAISASYAETASYFSGSITNATSASYALTASYFSGSITNATSASYALSASTTLSASVTQNSNASAQFPLVFVPNSDRITNLNTDSSSLYYIPISDTLFTTSSRAISASIADQATYSNTIGIAPDTSTNTFYPIPFASTAFGNASLYSDSSIINFNPSTNRLFITSISSSNITGSSFTGSFTGSLFGTASWANNVISASFASTASYFSGSITNATSASYALTASYFSGSISNATSASYAVTAGLAQRIEVTDLSGAAGAYEILFVDSSGSQIAYAELGNFYYVPASDTLYVDNIQVSQSLTARGVSLTGSFSGSLIGTASWANNVISASFATSASQAVNAQTASFLPVGTYNITSSWAVSASQAITASYVLNAVSSSFATSASFASTVPASGVIGLNLSQIATGSVTASVSLTQFTVTSGSSTELRVTGNGVTIGNVITDTHTVTGSLNVSGSITSSLLGTSSWAVSASQAITASYTLQAISASFASTSSFLNPGTYLITASWAQSASQAISASRAVSSSLALTANTASYVLNAVSASFASTASFLNTLNQNLTFNGNLTLNGTASISFLNVTIESASVIYSTGSNQFGDAPNDTQTLFGSVVIPTGSLTITGSTTSTGGFTGSLFGTSSWAVSASQATTASYILNAVSSSFASTASFVTTASWANSASNAINAQTASFLPVGTYNITSSWAVSASQALTASYVLNAVSSSFTISASNAINAQTASFLPVGTYNITSSWAVSASQAISSSYAETASFALTSSVSLATTENRILVMNKSGATITKGMVVHLTGSNNSSDTPYIITASYENDTFSANTLGIAYQTITTNNTGYVVTEGVLTGIDVTGFTSGQVIYLGSTGSITGSAPLAPLHSVRLGQVVRDSPSNNGAIYVRVDNGYELGELHDIRDFTTTSSYGDLLVKSGSIWINSKQLTGSYGLTGSLQATSFTGSLLGTASFAISASRAAQADNTSTIDINVFGSPVDSYLLMSNVAGTTGVAIGGDADLRYNSSTNVLTVPNISATSLTGSLSGSLIGTASWANNAITASFLNIGTYTITSSWAVSASQAVTASYVLNAISSSFASTASFAPNYVLNSQTSSFVTNAQTSSFVLNSQTSSMSVATASLALRASGSLTGSFTGSLTGSLLGTASFATSASQAITASYILNAVSSSFASTASYSNTLGAALSNQSDGTLRLVNSANTTISSVLLTASLANTASFINTLRQDAVLSGSLTISGSIIGSGSIYNTTISLLGATIVVNNTSSIAYGTRYLLDNVGVRSVFWNNRVLADPSQSVSVDWANRTLVSGSTNVLDWSSGTGSLIGTSSWATRAISASFLPVGTYNITSSWAVSASQAISASRATTSSFAISASWAPSVASNPFPYTGSAIISGSLTITGSLQVGVPGTNTAAIDTTVGTLGRGAITSVDWVNRILYNSTAVTSADWENAYLNDAAGLNSVLWGSRQLLNSSETTILDWENLALYDNATFPSMDWNARYLYDSAGNRSQNYDARALIYPNGTSVALSYGTQDQVTISGSTLITGSLTVGSSSLGPSENTITLGPRDTGSEGGQIGFNAPGGTYTSASMIDLYQNRLRILKGTNAGSTAEVAWWSMNNLQMALPGYNSATAFTGSEVAALGVDSSGNVLTTTIAGSTVFGNFAGTGFTNPIVTYLPFGTTTVSGAEAQRQIASPFAGTIKNLYVRTNNTAPATSYTTWTVRINGVATGITLIISGGQAAAKYFNTTNSASVAIGDEISLQVSTSVANGPQVNQYSFGIYPS